jgi:hypothetical protein
VVLYLTTSLRLGIICTLWPTDRQSGVIFSDQSLGSLVAFLFKYIVPVISISLLLLYPMNYFAVLVTCWFAALVTYCGAKNLIVRCYSELVVCCFSNLTALISM